MVSGDKLVRRFTESVLGNLYLQRCNLRDNTITFLYDAWELAVSNANN